jgi:hypothetical protein
MCTICMAALRIAHTLHVQDMHEYQRHDDTITKQTSCTRNTDADAVQSVATYTAYCQLMKRRQALALPCDINIKCSGMLRPVERHQSSTSRRNLMPSLSRSHRKVLQCSETSPTICQYKGFNNNEDQSEPQISHTHA